MEAEISKKIANSQKGTAEEGADDIKLAIELPVEKGNMTAQVVPLNTGSPVRNEANRTISIAEKWKQLQPIAVYNQQNTAKNNGKRFRL